MLSYAMEGMKIRPYVPDKDDETLINIGNAAWADSPDFVPQRIEEFRVVRQSPDWTAEGLFFAEVEGAPVAFVGAHVEKHRPEPLGFLGGPSVLPGVRRRGAGTALAERAFASLRERGMKQVMAGCEDCNTAALGFLSKLGFKPTRRFSLMRRPLSDLPSGVGENTEVTLENVGASDAALLVGLYNAAFKEHFAHRDKTVEEQEFGMRNAAELGYVVRRTVARLSGEPVGYLTHGIDPNENQKLGVKRGGFWTLGVLREFRNRGIATRLMLDGMVWLAGQGMTEAELGVDDENVTRARSLYERLGFAVVRSSTTFERDLG
jgi:ribosomal protein S18 acetylase RimI-like enzyme